MPLGVEIPVKEVQRYMGYRGMVDIAPDIQAKISKAIDMLGAQSHPRIVTKEYPLRVRGNDITIYNDTEEIVLTSESLARNLKGCCGAILPATCSSDGLPLHLQLTLQSIRLQALQRSKHFWTTRTLSSRRNTRHRDSS